jgi:hypothetical protein
VRNTLSIDCIPGKINYKFADSLVIVEYEIKAENGIVVVSSYQAKFEDI